MSVRVARLAGSLCCVSVAAVVFLSRIACYLPGSLDVGITVRETRGVARAGELVTLGLPIARSLDIRDTAALGVVDASGATVAAQFKVTSRWGGTPVDTGKPIRWLLVDFLASLPAGGRTTLRVTNSAKSAASPIAVGEDANAIAVDTGATAFRVSKSAFTLLDSARVGGEELLDASDLSRGVAVAAVDGTRLRSPADARILSTEITERGAVKVVIHQVAEFEDARLKDESEDSWSENTCFPWLYDCTELGRYRLRVSAWTTFVRGTGAVRIRVRVENPDVCPVTEGGEKRCALEHSLESIWWEDLSVRVGLAGGAQTFRAGSVSGSAADPVVVYQDSSGEPNWDYYKNLPVQTGGYTPGEWWRYGRFVTFKGYRTTVGAGVAESGNHMPGAISVLGGGRTAEMGVAGAWKHYPVAVRAGEGGSTLEAGLYPAEFGARHGLRAGERKTQEISLFLGADPDGSAGGRSQAWVDSPLGWSWDPGYALSTGALPGLSLAGIEPDYDLWNRASVDLQVSIDHNPYSWYEPSSILENLEEFDHWGKKEAGYKINDNEERTSTDLSKYGQYQGFLRQAIRNFERDPALADLWWEMSVDANKAQGDSGYLMQPTALETIWRGLNFAHCFHDNAENKTYPRGGGFGCDFAGDIGGMADLHVLTGFEPVADAIREHAENVYRRAGPDELDAYNREARRFASWIEVLVAAWDFYGEHKYLDRAVRMVELMSAGEGTSYVGCPCPGVPANDNSYAVNSYFAGWLVRSLGRLADALAANGETGTAAYAEVRRQLDSHAGWYAGKVVFEAFSGYTGSDEWVVPYLWYMNDQNGSNRAPVSAAYQLMAIDGLALAYGQTGNQAYLDTADKLFRTTMKMAFFWDGWPQFVYSTINDAGKLAEFGGFFVSR